MNSVDSSMNTFLDKEAIANDSYSLWLRGENALSLGAIHTAPERPKEPVQQPEEEQEPEPISITVDLPLVVAGKITLPEADKRLFYRESDLFPSTLTHIDAQALFPSSTESDRFSFEIVEGNPQYVARNTPAEGETQKVFHLSGYAIGNDGELHVKDAWLLGRNSEHYQAENEIFFIFRADRGNGGVLERNCILKTIGTTRQQLDCSNILDHLPEFTFGKTTDDILKIKVTHEASGQEKFVDVTIQPHPSVRAVIDECNAKENVFDKWVCLNSSRELLPQAELTTTEAQRNALPNGLIKPKSEYDLVLSADFDSWEDTRKYFNIPPKPEDDPLIEVRDGKLILHQKVRVPEGEPQPGQRCSYTGRGVGTKYLFDVKDGYLEIGIARYPTQISNGGNILLWARYGLGHGDMIAAPPRRIFAGMDTISRGELARVGFEEIDFFERWDGDQRWPAFVMHSYPQGSYVPIRAHLGYTTVATGNPSRGYKYRWAQTGYKFIVTEEGYFFGKYGMELAPGYLPRLFKNGRDVLLEHVSRGTPDTFIEETFGKAPKQIIIAPLSGAFSPTCTAADDETIEYDYIRLYKPRNGY